ncbi:MAG: hypothetical protein A3I49_01620 [Candidatus Levybacteria bacterium RIFCSPLOWO2_02_FULL_37_11]|nr:MAG: hypothetical protein A3I49_01620 [Candidatus Levybacteria bacterium RIFCSPLOWO2_02_FULL_37_11]
MRFPKISLSSIDWVLMGAVGTLISISLITLFSIDKDLFKSQFFFVLLSTSAFLIITQLNPQILMVYAKPFYLISIFLLLILFILGSEVRGAVRWIEVFGFQAQFSEILKPFLAVSFAFLLSDLRNYSYKNFLIIFLLLFPLFLLIFLQPDLGNSLIYFGTVLFVLLIYGFPFKYFISSLTLLIASFPALWFLLHDYQKERVLTFIDPSRDPLGTSYNAIQAVIAVGSGMFMGKGLGEGTQSHLRFLPENHTDFIFASLSEQLGFIGGIIVVAAFIVILYRLYIFFKSSDDPFSKNFSLIVLSLIFIHFFVNIGMNLGIIPVVGITLPFVSYGGSSLLSNFVMLGFLFVVLQKEKSEVLEIR